MILIILIWALVFFITLNYGLFFNEFCFKIGLVHSRENNVLYLALYGLVILSFLLNSISLFLPIGANVFYTISICSFALFIRNLSFWKHFCNSLNPSKKIFVFQLLLVILIAMYASFSDYTDNDVGLYIAQSIQWIEKYPAIPGLGNLHAVLGYNSSFLQLSALFSLSFTGVSFHILNSWLLLVFALICMSQFIKLNERASNIAIIPFLFLFTSFFFCRGKIGLPFTDIPVQIITWTVFILIFSNLYQEDQEKKISSVFLIFLLSMLAITIKLSSLILFIFGLLFYVFHLISFKRRLYLPVAILLSVFFTPWILRFIVLTGYPLYPVHFLDWFNFDWKIPLENVVKQENFITSWTSAAGSLHDPIIQNHDFIERFDIRVTFHSWYSRLSTLNLLLFWLSILSIPLMIFMLNVNRNNGKIRANKFIVLFWFVCLIGIIFWLFTAPDFRFIYGFIVVFILIPIYFIFISYGFSSKRILKVSLVLALSYLSVWPIKMYLNERVDLCASFIFPKNRYLNIKEKKITINGNNYLIPEKGIRCWNLPVPCLPCEGLDIVQRDKSDICKGFKVSKLMSQ